MSEVNRYVVDQAKVYMDSCQEDKSYQSEDSEQQSMIVITSNNLIESQLTEISIKGNKNFRFTDDLVTLMVEGLTKSNISLTTLALTHHRINDVGFIQLCRLILVWLTSDNISDSESLLPPVSVALWRHDRIAIPGCRREQHWTHRFSPLLHFPLTIA
jgi:hypothetical protein